MCIGAYITYKIFLKYVFCNLNYVILDASYLNENPLLILLNSFCHSPELFLKARAHTHTHTENHPREIHNNIINKTYCTINSSKTVMYVSLMF